MEDTRAKHGIVITNTLEKPTKSSFYTFLQREDTFNFTVITQKKGISISKVALKVFNHHSWKKI